MYSCMLYVEQLKTFVAAIRSIEPIAEYDAAYLKTLDGLIAPFTDEFELTQAQIEPILDIYKSRWERVQDSDADYTIYSPKNNEPWIAFAKTMAECLTTPKKTYLQILLPTITNTYDNNLLSPLSDCKNPLGFYLGDDNTTLYRVDGLFKNTRAHLFLSTYVKTKHMQNRALTLKELLRIRKKPANDLFCYSTELGFYKDFWVYLKKEILPKLSLNGEMPRHTFHWLLKAIECYLRGDYRAFGERFDRWLQLLMACKTSDVNHFYGQVIRMGEDGYYMLDILLDCLQENTGLETKLIAIAHWLYQYDASFVLSNESLHNIYAPFQGGILFTLDALKLSLSSLKTDNEMLLEKINRVLARLDKERSITSDIINCVKGIYATRWDDIKGTALEYTQLRAGENEAWITLAQKLAGARLIPKNYYCFLMPSIKKGQDEITFEPLTAYPLSHYIHSNNKLILLDNSLKHYQANGVFYNCLTNPPTPFTKDEKQLITKAAPRFQKFLKERYDPPIHIDTLLAIKTLLDKSLYPEGLYLGQEYNDLEMVQAQEAYDHFFKFLELLPAPERQRLDAQRIILRGKMKTFAQVMESIAKGECIATEGRYLLQLVLDYAPFIKFNPRFAEQFDVGAMRFSRQKKAVAHHDEIIKRIETLLISMMISPIGSVWESYNQKLAGIKQKVPKVLEPIFSYVLPKIEQGETVQLAEVYMKIMLEVITTLIEDKTVLNNWMRSVNLKRWLEAVVSGTLYKKPYITFEPELFFAVLHPQTLPYVGWHQKIEALLDQLLSVHIHASNPWQERLYMNIHYYHFLNKLSHSERKSLQSLLLKEQIKGIGSQSMPLSIKHRLAYFIHRVAKLGSGADGFEHAGFFAPRKRDKVGRYQDIKSLVETGIDERLERRLPVKRIKENMQKLLQNISKECDVTRISQYWQTLFGERIPSASAFKPDDVAMPFKP